MKEQYSISGLDSESLSAECRTTLFVKHVLPYEKLIRSLCIKYTIKHADAADNYIDVMVNLFRYIGSYDSSRPAKTWIYTVVLRYIFYLNKRHGRMQINDNIDVECLPYLFNEDHVSYNSMDDNNYRQHYSDELLAALDRLTPVQREALLLQQAGYKLDEIVEISFENGNLKTKNIETIKGRVFFAKKRMREMLTRDCRIK